MIKDDVTYYTKAPKDNRTFTPRDLANMFDTTPSYIHRLKQLLGVGYTKHIGNRDHALFTVSDYIKIKNYISVNKKIKLASVPDEEKILAASEDKHELVTDKRFLNLYYFPDVVPNCFKDLDDDEETEIKKGACNE